MTLTLDTISHLAELAVVGPLVWKGNRTLNRWIDIMKDFPPHAHANGTIRYPKGFEPGLVERVEQIGRY